MYEHAHTYGDSIADVYDRLCFYQHETPQTVDFLTTRCPEDGRILEYGVGTGRIAIPLAHTGRHVHGIDASARMLEQLAAKDPKGNVTTTHGDMTTTRVDDSFDIVLIAYNTLLYLPEQAQQIACLRNAAAHLNDHGTLVIDVYDPTELHYHTDQKTSTLPLSPHEILIVTSTPVRSRQLLAINQTICGPDGIRNLHEIQRYCWPSELDLMAQLAGLRLHERYADWTGAPITEHTNRIISVYRKDT